MELDRLGDLFVSIPEQLSEMLCLPDRRVAWFDCEIDRVFRSNEACQLIAKIRGVGPKTATAIVAAIGDGAEFKNGRHLVAWLGLVPKQHSSGNKQSALGHIRTWRPTSQNAPDSWRACGSAKGTKAP